MTVSLILLGGMLVLGGLVAGARRVWCRHRPVCSRPWTASAVTRRAADLRRVDTVADSTSERLGALVYRRSPVPLTPRQRQLLRLQDKPIAEFYADKIVMAVVGAILPALVGFGWGLMTGRPSWWPAGLALLGLVRRLLRA